LSTAAPILVFIFLFLVFDSYYGFAREAQSSAAQQSSAPVIRSVTRYVVLDVVVNDAQGHPVSGLAAADFTILENGHAQKISLFDPQNAAGASSVAAVSESMPPKKESSPRDTPAPATQPQTILVLDELNTVSQDMMFGLLQLKKFLASQPAVLSQPTSVLTFSKSGLETVVKPTRDHNKILDAVNHIELELPSHQVVFDSGSVQGGLSRLSTTLIAMDEIALSRGAQRGRKNLIWIGNGFPILSSISTFPEESQRAGLYVQETINWLQETETTVYTIDPRGLEVAPWSYGPTLGPAGLLTGELVFENVATRTGGIIFRGLNDTAAQIGSAASDGAHYYTLAYYPTDGRFDGKYRKIEVKVNRPGTTARTQSGYYATDEGIEASNKRVDFALSRALTSPLDFTSVQVDAAVKLPGGKPASARVELSIARESLSWQALPDGDHTTQITLVTSCVSSKGKVLWYRVRELEIRLNPKNFNDAASPGTKLFVYLALPEKTDHLRLVVRDSASGHLGTKDVAIAPIHVASGSH
jgi:VWFA-related protein